MARRDRSSSPRPKRRGPAGRGGGERPRPPRGEEAPRRDGPPGRRETPREDARPLGGRMIIYGRNAVREALRGPRRVHRVWATEAAEREGWGGMPVIVVSAEEIEERAGSEAHQGVCAEVEPYAYANSAALLAVPNPLIVALDEVTDPQNLGAICRTAECVGATGVVFPERRSAEVTPAVCKASAGAVEHLAIARVRNLADFLGEAKAAGCWSYGAAAGARTPYDRPDYSGGVVVVLGAEGKGLRPRVAAACDDLIALPLLGRIESLNVSATAAVVLYEILQQRLDTST
jgi:23S rRNA (guanosine2251-2'-O)-methyltransferase